MNPAIEKINAEIAEVELKLDGLHSKKFRMRDADGNIEMEKLMQIQEQIHEKSGIRTGLMRALTIIKDMPEAENSGI